MKRQAAPVVSVIIATYNWSSALRLALQSVLLQTFTDFEVLVVGDCCTDDSEAVVRSFNDKRIVWANLDVNHGSQYAPNNHAIAKARGRFIAYLGHDDIWWPTHLQSLVDTAERSGADVAAAMTIMYGPAETGIFSVTGLFPAGEFHPRYFFPPSSMLHTRRLVEEVGGWRSPSEAVMAVDVDLFRRFHRHGAKFVASRRLTVFKFNSAWRRNAYKLRRTVEQEKVLEAARHRDSTFLEEQFTSVVQAVIEDRLFRLELPPTSMTAAQPAHEQTATFKGTGRQSAPLTVKSVAGRLRFYVEDSFAPFEWHPVEHYKGEVRRWTGPSTQSSFRLPAAFGGPFRLEIHVTAVLNEPDLLEAVLLAGDRELPSTKTRRDSEGWTWAADVDPADFDEAIEMLTIRLPRVRRALDLDINDDRRWIGIQVSAIDLLSH